MATKAMETRCTRIAPAGNAAGPALDDGRAATTRLPRRDRLSRELVLLVFTGRGAPHDGAAKKSPSQTPA
jgi:hypothetical protein